MEFTLLTKEQSDILKRNDGKCIFIDPKKANETGIVRYLKSQEYVKYVGNLDYSKVLITEKGKQYLEYEKKYFENENNFLKQLESIKNIANSAEEHSNTAKEQVVILKKQVKNYEKQIKILKDQAKDYKKQVDILEKQAKDIKKQTELAIKQAEDSEVDAKKARIISIISIIVSIGIPALKYLVPLIETLINSFNQ